MSFKSFKPKKCKSAFKNKGFIERVKRRDHYFYYLENEGRITNIFTKVSHTNKKTIGRPLFSKMARDLNISMQFLREFIECDKNEEDLINELRNKNLI